jgi:hypothetical protein
MASRKSEDEPRPNAHQEPDVEVTELYDAGAMMERRTRGRAQKPPGPEPDEGAKERKALKKVKLHSFTANPLSIEALGTSKLQWQVTGIPPDDPTVILGVSLDDEEVAPTGSKEVSPSFTRTFHLNAKGSVVDQPLGTAQVEVDFGACQEREVLPVAIQGRIEDEIDAQLAGSRKVKPKGGSKARLGDFRLDVTIPLEIEVRNWFNADMDVSLRFGLFASSERVRSDLREVSADVSWTLLEHLAGLGLTGIIQSALQQLAEAFLDLVGDLLADRLASLVQNEVNRELAQLNADNPPVPFHLHSMGVSDLGLAFRFCPAPAP